MAETVHAVVGEGEGEGALEEDLGKDGHGTHGSSHGGRLEMPSESGGDEISGGPEVEGAGEGDTSDTVQRGANPANLGLVDGKVGSDGAAETLLNEDLGWVLGVGRGGDLSIDHESRVSSRLRFLQMT
jgi:hypothetical protein